MKAVSDKDVAFEDERLNSVLTKKGLKVRDKEGADVNVLGHEGLEGLNDSTLTNRHVENDFIDGQNYIVKKDIGYILLGNYRQEKEEDENSNKDGNVHYDVKDANEDVNVRVRDDAFISNGHVPQNVVNASQEN